MLKPLELNTPDQQNIRFTGELKDLLMFPRLLTDISFFLRETVVLSVSEKTRVRSPETKFILPISAVITAFRIFLAT